MTTWYCKDSPELHVGPGEPKDDVVFSRGFLEIPRDDPKYDEKVKWINHSAPAYGITCLGEDTELVPDGDGERCLFPGCSKSFGTPKALQMHMLSHKPKAPKAPKA